MKKNTMIPALGFLILAIVAIVFISKDGANNGAENKAVKSDIILFYGIGCPYCDVVDEFLDEVKAQEIISYRHLEVYNNQANASLMQGKARICGLNTNSIGVPFLWTGDSCLIGDKDIISFFDTELAKIESLNPENGIVIDEVVNGVNNNGISNDEVLNQIEEGTVLNEEEELLEAKVNNDENLSIDNEGYLNTDNKEEVNNLQE